MAIKLVNGIKKAVTSIDKKNAEVVKEVTTIIPLQGKQSKIVEDLNLAKVRVSLSYTKNLGHYESCKLNVELETTCSKNYIDEEFAENNKWVDEKLKKLIEEVKTNL